MLIGFRKFVCDFYMEEGLINHVLVMLKGNIEYLKILYKRNVILKYKHSFLYVWYMILYSTGESVYSTIFSKLSSVGLFQTVFDIWKFWLKSTFATGPLL